MFQSRATIGRTSKTSTSSAVPRWYQSLAMDQPIEWLEKMAEFVAGHEHILQQLTEALNKLNTRVDEIVSKTNELGSIFSGQRRTGEEAEHSTVPSGAPSVR